jgi:hypothetical protein
VRALRWFVVVTCITCFGQIVPRSAQAEDAAPAHPSYAGDILTRSTLTGDWGGARDDLAAKGVTIDLNSTQVGDSVVSGGKHDDVWEYGGRGDFMLNVDTQKPCMVRPTTCAAIPGFSHSKAPMASITGLWRAVSEVRP